MVTAVAWALEADFDRNGSYETDLTSYIDQNSTISVKRGVNADGTPMVSQFTVTLDNSSGIFSTRYPSSALYGKLEADIPLRITANNGTGYTAWTGYAKSWRARYAGAAAANRMELTAQDILGAYLQTSGNVNVTVDTSRDTDAALTAIMDALGLTVTTDYVFDDGLQDLPYHFVSNQKAMDAILDAVRAEMGGQIWVRADGVLRFQNRAARLGISGATQWGDGTNITPDFLGGGFDVDEKDADRVDEVTVLGTVYNTDYPDQEVFRLRENAQARPTANSPLLAAGATVTYTFDLPAPALELTTVTARTDYLANDAIDGSGTDRTSSLTVVATLAGASVTVKLTNTYSGGIYLTFLRFRAKPVSSIGQAVRMVATKSIPYAKTARGISLAVPFVGLAAQQKLGDYAVGVLMTYRQSYPLVTLPFSWTHDDIVDAMLGVELGDKVRYTDKLGNTAWTSNIDDWFYVVAIEHQYSPTKPGKTKITLEPCANYFNLDALEYDWFTRADGALGSTTRGTAWADATNVLVASNKAKPNNTASQKPSVDIGVSDMRVCVTLSGIAGTAQGGVNYRKTDTSNYLRAYVDYGNSLVVLEKVVATVVTQIASAAWTPTAGCELMVIVQGTRHRVFVDRVQLIDTTSSQFSTSTKVGLYTKNTTAMSVDDFAALGLS